MVIVIETHSGGSRGSGSDGIVVETHSGGSSGSGSNGNSSRNSQWW